MYARNLPDGGGQPAPPPPPPDLPALAATAHAATVAFYALADDPGAAFDDVYAAWDRAVAAEDAHWQAAQPAAIARKWQGVRPA